MSYLLFMDESGHDHKTLPYEVHGGIALHASRLWPFVTAITTLEQAAFGDFLHRYKSEIKGEKLLDKDRLRWAAQDSQMDDISRRRHCLGFLNKDIEKKSPQRNEFTAYGQACLLMARGIFDLLLDHDAKIFASAIPRKVKKPETQEADQYLRKDIVFLLERYFYLLEAKKETGLIVLDETEKALDRRFVSRLERYFKFTQTGRYRSPRIIPSPFFVSSDMAYPVQVADVCIYAINHCFRLPAQGMDAPPRQDLQKEFAGRIGALQFRGEGYKDGAVFPSYGIVFVPDPYEGKPQK